MSRSFPHTKPGPVNWHLQDDHTSVIDIDGYLGRDILQEWITGKKSDNSSEQIKAALREISTPRIIVNINSPGGDLNEALVIMNLLQAKRAEIITNVMGFSAGPAAVVALGGSVRRMSQNAFLLIARTTLPVCMYMNQNTAKDLQQEMETMDRNIIRMFADRGGADPKRIAHLMDAGNGYGRWIDAEAALEYGLIDEIYNPADEADEFLDRLSPDENSRMRNTQRTLARSAVTGAETTDRQKTAERLQRRQTTLEARAKATPAPDVVKAVYRGSEAEIAMLYHECGHAIIGHLFGLSTTELSVSTGPEGVKGHISFDLGFSTIEDTFSPIRRLALIAAGSVADAGYQGKDMKDLTVADLNGSPGNPGSDAYRFNQVLQELPVEIRDSLAEKALRFTGSRLIRNWHHVNDLAEFVGRTGTISAQEFDRWISKRKSFYAFYP